MKKSGPKELKFINYKRYIIVLSVLLTALISINIMFRVSTVFAQAYCTAVYPNVVKVMGAVSSLAPFSIIEILIYVAAVIVIYAIVRLIITLVHNHSKASICFFTYRLKKYLLNLACIVMVCLLILSFNCTILYHRLSFTVCANMELEAHSVDELAALFKIIADDAADLSDKVERDSNGVFTTGSLDVNELCVDAMHAVRQSYPFMTDYYPHAKPILASKLMSATGMEGFYSPFTMEANYNSDIPDIDIPHTICHELAHLSGFIHEDEANFIGYAACMASDSESLRYSASVEMLIYVMNELYNNLSSEHYSKLISTLDRGVITDLNAQGKYWREAGNMFGGSLNDAVQSANDTYIKLNGDTEGDVRYSMVTELLIDYYSDKIDKILDADK